MTNAESGIVQRLTKPALVFAAIVVVGAFGYWLLEDMTPDTHLQAGDIVVALGTRAQLAALREKAC